MIQVDIRTGDQEARRSKWITARALRPREAPKEIQTRKQNHERITERQVRKTRRATPKEKAERKRERKREREREAEERKTDTATRSRQSPARYRSRHPQMVAESGGNEHRTHTRMTDNIVCR